MTRATDSKTKILQGTATPNFHPKTLFLLFWLQNYVILWTVAICLSMFSLTLQQPCCLAQRMFFVFPMVGGCHFKALGLTLSDIHDIRENAVFWALILFFSKGAVFYKKIKLLPGCVHSAPSAKVSGPFLTIFLAKFFKWTNPLLIDWLWLNSVWYFPCVLCLTSTRMWIQLPWCVKCILLCVDRNWCGIDKFCFATNSISNTGRSRLFRKWIIQTSRQFNSKSCGNHT